MGTVRFSRRARMVAPGAPSGDVHLEAPPEVPRIIPGNLLMKLLPVVMILATLGMVAFIFTEGGRDNPIFLMFPLMMLMSTVGMITTSGTGRGGSQRAAEMNEDRKDYLRYLGQMRDRARRTAEDQRAALEWAHPEPGTLWSLAGSRRMWERRPGDPDYCEVRMGSGPQRLATRLVSPTTGPVEELEPVTTSALRRFVRTHSTVTDLPLAVSLRGVAALGLGGEPAAARALARALVAELATLHAPEDLVIAVVARGPAARDWEWVKWLPHAQHPTATDGLGPRRLLVGSIAELEDLLVAELADRPRFSRSTPPPTDRPHVVVVVEDGDVDRSTEIIADGGLAGVTVVDLSDSLGTMTARRGLRLVVEHDSLGALTGQGVEVLGVPGALRRVEAEALARRLAPFRVGDDGGDGADDGPDESLLELLGLPGDPRQFDPAQAWRPRAAASRSGRDRLRVPIGIGAGGVPVALDIKEAAEEGMGPHGLCIGATGSGKSELLRTLVLGLIASHSPESLNLVLVDFKGGATFLGLGSAPHVAAVITNLADDLTQVDRMRDALAGELNRRQELLRDAGNFANVTQYERARAAGADLAPLPALFIVVDEFTEMLAQKPDFIELFVAIGRLGRSLRIHLLLASQRLDEGRLRGLESHLSYRIALKTFSAGDSRAVLGVPDAYELPPVPGSGYLKVDTSSLTRFKASYVSGPLRSAGARPVSGATVSADRRPRLFVPEYVEPPALPEPVPEPDPAEGTQLSILDVLVERMAGHGPPAHEVWLPPLSDPPTLDGLLPPLSVTPDRGLCPVGFVGSSRLTVPLGLVDRPYEQRRDLLWADLSGAAGHAVVTGGPQSGKSTVLRSMLLSLALTHTPSEMQFFALDFGGGTLAPLDGLPHSAGVAGRLEPDTVRRIVAQVAGILVEREQRFRALGVDGVADFRARRRRGELAEDTFGDVFLVIDGWLAFRQEFDALEMRILDIATRGLSYGVHVMVSATRWAEIRPGLKDLLGTRLELRLGDPTESEMDRRAAVNVPSGRPGRGLGRDKLHFLTALPRIDGRAATDDLGAAVTDAVARVRTAWAGDAAARVRLLPDLLPHAALESVATRAGTGAIPVGVDENDLAPVYLDFDAEPHFLCFGDGESGKTNLLRTVAAGITGRCTPAQARILVVDYRRGLLGQVGQDHLIGYASTAQALAPLIGGVRQALEQRLPGPGVTPEQLRTRSWWTGSEIYVLVDDYDLVVTQAGNPIAPLLDFLGQAKDVGLHLVLARRCGGAARALFEPVLGRVRELGSPGIILNGSRDEGPLLGTVKPAAMPPGRGTVVSRRTGERMVQLAWLDPV